MLEVHKSKNKVVRVAVVEKEGYSYVDIRVWVKGDKVYPTKEGFTLLLDRWDDFVELVLGVDKLIAKRRIGYLEERDRC